MVFSLYTLICTLCLPSYVCNYSSFTALDDYSLDNHLRPYLYQTHAGELTINFMLLILLNDYYFVNQYLVYRIVKFELIFIKC